MKGPSLLNSYLAYRSLQPLLKTYWQAKTFTLCFLKDINILISWKNIDIVYFYQGFLFCAENKIDKSGELFILHIT